MAGTLPDSTPGVRATRFLRQLRSEAAASDFVVAHQFITDEQIKAAASYEVRRGGRSRLLAQRVVWRNAFDKTITVSRAAQASDVDSLEDPMSIDSEAGTEGPDDETVVDAEVAQSRMGENDRSVVGGSSIGDASSDVGMDDGDTAEEQVQELGGEAPKTDGARLTEASLNELAQHLSSDKADVGDSVRFQRGKKKMKGDKNPRKDSRVKGKKSKPLFMDGGLYSAQLGSVETRRGYQVWCTTCADDQAPVCSCGSRALEHPQRFPRKKGAPLVSRCLDCSKKHTFDRIFLNPTPECQGHWGYIQLPPGLWLVNPLAWSLVLTLLGAKCWWCHRFMAGRFALARRVASLRLLNAGVWQPVHEEYLDWHFPEPRIAEREKKAREDRKAQQLSKRDVKLHAYTRQQESREVIEMMRWVEKEIAKGQSQAQQQSAGALFVRRKAEADFVWSILKKPRPKGRKCACPHCGLNSPRRVCDRAHAAYFYDIARVDMADNIEIARNRNMQLMMLPGWRDKPAKDRDVTITLPQYDPHHTFTGRIVEVSGEIDDDSSSVKVDFGERVPKEEGKTGVREIPAPYWRDEAFSIGGVSWARKAWELQKFMDYTVRCKQGGGEIGQRKRGRTSNKQERESQPRSVVCLPPKHIKHHLQMLFRFESELLGNLFHNMCASLPGEAITPKDYWKGLVHQHISIGPNRFRPFRVQEDTIILDDQTKQLSNILRRVRDVEQPARIAAAKPALVQRRIEARFRDLHERAEELAKSVGLAKTECHLLSKPIDQILGEKRPPSEDFLLIMPRTFEEHVVIPLQTSYRAIMYANKDAGLEVSAKERKSTQTVFEGKKGLLRSHLMGKRVNQAARTVISPDNAIEDDQVFLPRRFARMLTMPEVLPVRWQLEELDARVAAGNAALIPQRDALIARRGFLERSILNGPVYPGCTRVELDGEPTVPGEKGNVERALEIINKELAKERRPDWMPLWMRAELTDKQQRITVGYDEPDEMSGEQALSYVLWVESILEKRAAEGQDADIKVYWKVFRHLSNDDWGILNRQPTLHRSSWLAERMRIGRDGAGRLKTFRFHYANCKGFNADFDGDEMNLHAPQNVRAQAELRTLTCSRQHFISATSGKPLRGLIQDHVVAGVALTQPDTFLGKAEFDRLLYEAFAKYSGGRYLIPPRPEPAVRAKRKDSKGRAFWCELWTGKQVMSQLLRFVTMNHGVAGRYAKGLCFFGRTALQPAAFGRAGCPDIPADPHMEHDKVEVINDQLCRGIFDKSQLGAGGSVVESVHQVHGQEAAGALLGLFSRVFTEHLKHRGFTMGVTDMFLSNEDERAAKLRKLDDSTDGLTTEAERLTSALSIASELNKTCFPACLQKPLPHNSLAAMTMSGAKGSNVNSTQMAVLLGLQTFDGKRVEPMPSGKTLPGTVLGDGRARCGGIGLGRFLSGIRPQQYVVHSTSGRDGCIDTAVKTARSGYLQHSVVKGLEGLGIEWMRKEGQAGTDAAVVDEDGVVVQLAFGHDGIDPSKGAEVKKNSGGKLVDAVAYHTRVACAEGAGTAWRELRSAAAPAKQARNAQDRELALRIPGRKKGVISVDNSAVTPRLRVLRITHAHQPKKDPRPSTDKRLSQYSEKPDKLISGLLKRYGMEKEPQTVDVTPDVGAPSFIPDGTEVEIVEAAGPPGTVRIRAKDVVGLVAAAHVKETGADADTVVDSATVDRLLQSAVKDCLEAEQKAYDAALSARCRRTQIPAHEPVGVIAAQAIGEPSTQMTLNTFHSVGQTVSHVTEGIPRLRQILQNAQDNSPTVMLPVVGLGDDNPKAPLVADAVLRMHTLLQPKTLADVLCDSRPWELSARPVSGGDDRFQTIDVIIRLDDSKLKAYYADDLGVASMGGAGEEDEGEEDADWTDPATWAGDDGTKETVLESKAAWKSEAMGLLAKPREEGKKSGRGRKKKVDTEEEEGKRPAGAATATASRWRLFPSHGGGASADVRAALEVFNAQVIRLLDNAWKWDRHGSPNAMDLLHGCCEGKRPEDCGVPEFSPADAPPAVGGHASAPFSVAAFQHIGSASQDLSLKSKVKQVSMTKKRPDIFQKTDAEDMPEDTSRPGMGDSDKAARASAHVAIVPQGICTEDRDVEDRDHALRYHFTVRCPLHCRANWASLLRKALRASLLRKKATRGITGVFFQQNDSNTGGTLFVKGAKLRQVIDLVWRFPELPDVEKYLLFNKIQTTDHNDSCAVLGVEASEQALLQELCRLFSPYGVDYRWLTLVADRCMQHGRWLGFSRHKVIATTPSLYCRMTFETALRVLENAPRHGMMESLKNPSAKIMIGDWNTSDLAGISAPAPGAQAAGSRTAPSINLSAAVPEVPAAAGKKRKEAGSGAPAKRPRTEVATEPVTAESLFAEVKAWCQKRGKGAETVADEKLRKWAAQHTDRPARLFEKLADKFGGGKKRKRSDKT
eukprot:TRINITY_DN97_c0_g1_i1.p1 TRINITY_DN97_c0_g1~~TRINITY_DN97_c0_g1_i1.p1  ORF type:complete len:2457 (+),score=753.39 TRINITY_DN97_c0_g1_i1:58-7371(+)